MENEKTFQFTAGLLARSLFRDMLQSEVFEGRKIRWMERRGWLESTFYVKVPASEAEATASRIEAYVTSLGQA